MVDTTIFEAIFSQFCYNPSEPLIFTSGLFLFLLLGFTLFYTALYRTVTLRIVYVIAFSLFFYYKTSGLYFLLLVGLSVSDFVIGHLINIFRRKSLRKIALALSVCINLGILCYFKYTALLGDLYNNIFSGNLDFSDIFLPIGVSFFTFQSMSYTIDIYRKHITPLKNWLDYFFYLSFFPQLVAGPIVRARDFIPQIRKNPVVVSRYDLGLALFMICCGLIKKAIISDYISMNFVDRVFDAPLLYSGVENLLGVYGYAIQIYCDFSGYSDMAIGLALLLGFKFPENFNSPYKSATITEFWRRWHISLSSWLKDYLYISLGGNRKGRVRTYFNLMITMLLGGLWHGASWRFLLWGAIHGVSLAVHKFTMKRFPSFKPLGSQMNPVRRLLGVIITFNVVCFAWIFFRATSFESAVQVISQIFTAFNPEIFWEVLSGYKLVMILIALAYLAHHQPNCIFRFFEKLFIKTPIFFYPVILALLIWGVMQFRSGDIQPFIYFQF